MKIDKQKMIIIIVGLVGCLLTSLTGIAAVMISKNWSLQGGWSEFFLRLSISYPASCCVVVLIFPALVPRLTRFFDQRIK
jgi:hypothetical protein